MYLVLNISGNNLTIGDLKVDLTKNQMLDLDKVKKTIIKSEDSRDVQYGVKSGKLRIISHDRGGVYKEDEKPSVKTIVSQENTAIDENKMISSIEKIIEEKLKSKSDESSQILSLLKSLSNKAGIETEDTQISGQKLSEIQSRKLDRLTENSKGEIDKNEEKTVVDNKIKDEINDLGDFLN